MTYTGKPVELDLWVVEAVRKLDPFFNDLVDKSLETGTIKIKEVGKISHEKQHLYRCVLGKEFWMNEEIPMYSTRAGDQEECFGCEKALPVEITMGLNMCPLERVDYADYEEREIQFAHQRKAIDEYNDRQPDFDDDEDDDFEDD